MGEREQASSNQKYLNLPRLFLVGKDDGQE
jgi:hypothetical protein